MQYHISQIATVVQGKIIFLQEDVIVRELLMDTRRAVFPESSLFFALKGARRDGHSFINEAYKKGVRNFIVSRQLDSDLPGSNIILVKDVLDALQSLAAYHRNQFHFLPDGRQLPVVGITGSNGKTIVKEWLNQLLHDRYEIVRSPKSYNSQIGVPLSVWQMGKSDTLGIFEAGISQPGEMEKLRRIIQPTIGILTNVGDAHAGGFLNIQQKTVEKLLLFSNVKTLIYCKDYPEITESIDSLKEHSKFSEFLEIICWSRITEAQLRIISINKEETQDNINGKNKRVSGSIIKGEFKGKKIGIVIPFTDEASIENAINCWCLLLYLQVPDEEISFKMNSLQAVAMRLELKEGINNSTLINDSYSADISSLKIALDYLEQQHQHPGRTVILTDFLESGRSEKELYTDIATLLQQHKVDRFIGIGEVILRNQSFFRQNMFITSSFFSSVEEFKQNFARTHFSNETILIKGARTFAMERINSMLEKQTHQTLLEIDLDALLHNLHAYQQVLSPSTKLMAMVKAFSYGSGSYEIASALQFNKVDYLAVAYADEGVELRKGGITLPVMVMNPDEYSFNTLVSYNLEPEMYSLELIQAFEVFLKKEGLVQFPIHIELETGMNRLGFAKDDLIQLVQLLQSNTFRVQSVFSHLVASEDPAFDYFTQQQAALFIEMSDAIKAALPYSFIRHLCNTSGISRHPSLQFDMVRMGIGLYGIDSARKGKLREVSTLRSAIAQVKHLKAGETVSYGRSGVLLRDSLIATVRLGYADGYPRSLGNGKGNMLVHGRLAPTVGHICMDMTMVDITDIPGVKDGEEVVVFGKGLPVADVARWAGTIPYEMLTGISQRVKRVYFQE
jgi:alanine racemase